MKMMSGLLRPWSGGTSKFLSDHQVLTDAVSRPRQIFPDAKNSHNGKAKSADPDPLSIRSRAKIARLNRANKRVPPADHEIEYEDDDDEPEGAAEHNN
jgi:hypothetical protein